MSNFFKRIKAERELRKALKEGKEFLLRCVKENYEDGGKTPCQCKDVFTGKSLSDNCEICGRKK